MIGKLIGSEVIKRLPVEIAKVLARLARMAYTALSAALVAAALAVLAALSGGFARMRKKPAPFLIAAASIIFLTLALTVFAAGVRRPAASAAASATTNISASFAIPPEELFIPREPDFVPDFILEREPRNFWYIEDIRPYWRVPSNSEQVPLGYWQGVLRSTVDELMERVP